MLSKAIPDFPNYIITSNGVITRNTKMFKVFFNNKNVPCVRLSRDGSQYVFSVARLVALTFLSDGRKSPSDVGLYKDGNNHNVDKDNLEWASRSKAYSAMYDKENRYSEHRLRKLRDKICKPVDKCKIENNKLVVVETYMSIREAADAVETSSASILRCLKHPNNKCNGYYWKYHNEEDN